MVSSLERTAATVSGKLFRMTYYYARYVHMLPFKVESVGEKSLQASRDTCYTGFCMLFRAAFSIIFFYGTLNLWQSTDQVFNYLNVTLMNVIIFNSLTTVAMQFWLSARFIAVTNAFVRLFERARTMVPTTYNICGTHVLTLLCMKLVCLGQELVSGLLYTLQADGVSEFLLYASDSYLSLGCSMVLHIACLSYLLTASLYQAINHILEQDILPKLKHLNNKVARYGGVTSRHFKRLNSLTSQLNDCCDMYKEVYTISRKLHKLLEFPLLCTVLGAFVEVVVTVYYIVCQINAAHITEWNLIATCFKNVVDIQMLTLASHMAIKSSQIARRLSLDVVFTKDYEALSSSLETLLLHLNIYELRLDLMGLFELSNELILSFLSGLVTFIIYILQFASSEYEIEFKNH